MTQSLITLDQATIPAGGSGTSYTFSHICGTQKNRALVVGIIGDTATNNITGVTYNSVAMTLATTVQVPGDRWHYLYYLVNPASGSNTVAISATGSGFIIPGSISYNGVNQTSPINVTNTATGTSGSISCSVTTTVAGCMLVSSFRGASAVTPGTNTYNRLMYQNGTIAGMSDSGACVAAGSNTMSETTTPNWCMIIAALAPAPVGNITNLSALANVSALTI